MKKPNYMEALLAFIFLCLGIGFLICGLLCLVGIMKPSAHSNIQDPTDLGMLFCLLGIIFVIIQIILKKMVRKKVEQIKQLQQTGIRITGTVETVYLQKWTKFNGQSPFRIKYTYSYQGKSYHKTSCYIWDKPKFVDGDEIEIYVDENGHAALVE